MSPPPGWWTPRYRASPMPTQSWGQEATSEAEQPGLNPACEMECRLHPALFQVKTSFPERKMFRLNLSSGEPARQTLTCTAEYALHSTTTSQWNKESGILHGFIEAFHPVLGAITSPSLQTLHALCFFLLPSPLRKQHKAEGEISHDLQFLKKHCWVWHDNLAG